VLWTEFVGGLIGGTITAGLSQWFGYRAGRLDTLEELGKKDDKPAPKSGPYRTPAELTDPPMGLDSDDAEKGGWLYAPQTECPRCDAKGEVQHRGRFTGDHALQLVSSTIQQSLKCEGHPPRAHIHYQCWSCGADWAEVPPEEYGNDEEDDD
jgi:hypothetical protein